MGKFAEKFEKPKAILAVSAHWVTQGTRVNDAMSPKQIDDMYGFPEELNQLIYTPKGHPDLAHKAMELIDRNGHVDNSWGIDHGTWSVLCKMYPRADEFDLDIKNKIVQQNHMNVMDYRRIGKASDLAFFTTEHFDRLLYVLGASGEDDELTIFNESRLMSSMSMTAYRFD